ncbi:MAG TPA: hypothetical protein VLA61_10690 [Ideonella sp.]|uniref:hypothetical protein n=1 Tax=Ideonella sp. TaxID=1929293 RepID=UPI002C53CC31|nr:hypothetical protein [Ideonella sp.]HSI48728.1 hypothetical protein [Ideonella sp.]
MKNDTRFAAWMASRSALMLTTAVMAISLLASLVQIAEMQRSGSLLARAQLPQAAAAVPALWPLDVQDAPASAVTAPGGRFAT